MIVFRYLNVIVIYKNSVVRVVLYVLFNRVKLNLRRKGSVIFQFKKYVKEGTERSQAWNFCMLNFSSVESVVWHLILR